MLQQVIIQLIVRVNEQLIFQLGNIQLFLRNDQLERIQRTFPNKLKECTQFSTQLHSSQYTYVHEEHN